MKKKQEGAGTLTKTKKPKDPGPTQKADVKKKESSIFSVILDPFYKMITGLSKADFSRLKNLKSELSKDPQVKKPETAQDTICFEKMYKEGLCLVRDNFYTKMIEFYDVNYELLDVEEQADMLSGYSSFINYFTPGIKFELFLFNRKVSEEDLIKSFDIDAQGDAVDELRKEFSDMLKVQNTKGNNGILKSKYLVFGIEAKNKDEALSKLNTIEADITKNLRSLGTSVRSLDGKERLLVLHDFFNQGNISPFRFSFKDMAESGHMVKDYVAPSAFDFRFPSRFKIGNMFGSVFYVDITAPRLSDELLRNLLNIDSNISVSIHMETKDPVKAMKFLKKKLSEIQASKINEQKKAVRTGYDMDIIPSDINTYEQDTLKLLEDLNSSNQKIVQLTFIISVFAPTKKDLDNLTQRVNGIIQQGNCDIVNLQYQQEGAVNTAAPIGINLVGDPRDLPTKSVAVMIPFQTQELFMGGQSLYYGVNTLSNNMIMADRKKLRTPNGIVIGTPGSGKSFAAKREMMMCYLITRDDIMICDPEGEYYPLVNSLGGQVIRLSTNSNDYLNPMDIHVKKDMKRQDFNDLMRVKSAFVITMCDAIAGDDKRLNNLEKGIIDCCLERLYNRYFEDPKPENMPILEDLQKELLKYEPDGISEELAYDARRSAVRISQSLELYVHGSQNFFNHRTNVDAGNRMICFDIRDLSEQLKHLGMLIVQDAVWNRVSENRQRKVATRYYCDEFHLLLREEQTARYMVEIWKRFRKWGGIPTGLTQNVKDFFMSPQIEGILGNSDFLYILNQSPNDKELLVQKLHLSNEQLKYVTNSEQGSGLILFDKVCIPFMDHFPTDTKCYKVMNTKPEES